MFQWFDAFCAWFQSPCFYNILFSLSLVFAVAVIVGGVLLCDYRYRKKGALLRTYSYGMVLSVFLSSFFLFYPFYCAQPIASPFPRLLSAVLLALQSAIKIFFGDFDVFALVDHITVISMNTGLRSASHWALVCLSAAAPVLSISCLVSLIHLVFHRIRIERFSSELDIFVFNELTPASVTLAKSVYEDYQADNKPLPRIVFCDVFDEENEKSFNLLTDARKIGGVCYKDDLLVVDEKLRHYYKRDDKAAVSYFLIGDDETENVYQACKLASVYDKPPEETDIKRHIHVYVSAVKESSISILDSLTFLHGDQLKDKKAFKTFADKLVLESVEGFNNAYATICDQTDKLFKCTEETMMIIIKRIDPIKRLVWKTLLDKDNFLYEKGKKTLPILITGVSQYGLEFLKALCWFYQLPVEDFCVDIHVVDKRQDLREFLMGVCPELIAYGECGGDGEARFNITLHGGVDAFGGELERIIRDTANLRHARAAFACLGDDALNTEMALKLRSLFLRYNADNAAKIFAVVYDNVLHENLAHKLNSPEKYDETLIPPGTPDDKHYIPYDISFIGAFQSLYNYNEIKGYSCLIADTVSDEGLTVRACNEQTAFFHHMVWSLGKAFQAVADNEETAAPPKAPATATATDAEQKPKPVITSDKIAANFAEYCNFEYYRMSSLATCMHQHMLSTQAPFSAAFANATFAMRTPDIAKEGSKQDTPEVKKLRRLEHARWNCYMRGEGHVYAEKTSKIAKTNKNLCHYDDLDPLERPKDSLFLAIHS